MAYRKLFSIPPYWQAELVSRGILLNGAELTADGRQYVLDDFDTFCSDQIKRVVNTLHEAHRRVRLGPELLPKEIEEGSAFVETRR